MHLWSPLLPHGDLQHELQGNLCSGTWITSSSSSFTDPRVYRDVDLRFLSLAAVAVAHDFSPLEYIMPGMLPLLLMADGVSLEQ